MRTDRRRPPLVGSTSSSAVVSVTRFKANPSRFLARVRAGQTLLLTERRRPVARIDPLTPGDDPAAVVAMLVAAGLARPPVAPLSDGFFTAPQVADPEGRVLAALLDERTCGEGTKLTVGSPRPTPDGGK